MPRKSPYTILLSQDEKRSLEKCARSYMSPYIKVIRAKIALYAAQDMRNDQIGKRLELPRQIVSKWRKRFFEKRLAGLEDEQRQGRPPAFPPTSRH